MEGGYGPDMLGDEIGRTLVGSHEHTPFNGIFRFRCDRHRIRCFAFAKGLPEIRIELRWCTGEETATCNGLLTAQDGGGFGHIRSSHVGRDWGLFIFSQQHKVRSLEKSGNERLVDDRIGAHHYDWAVMGGSASFIKNVCKLCFAELPDQTLTQREGP